MTLEEHMKMFHNQVGKHGSHGEYTEIRDYIDSLSNSEMLDALLGDDWDEYEEETKSDPALTKLEVAQNLTITTAQAIVDANAASWDAQQHVYMTQEEYQDALEMLSLAEQQQ